MSADLKAVGIDAERRAEMLELLDVARKQVESGEMRSLAILKDLGAKGYDACWSRSDDKYGMIGLALAASIARIER